MAFVAPGVKEARGKSSHILATNWFSRIHDIQQTSLLLALSCPKSILEHCDMGKQFLPMEMLKQSHSVQWCPVFSLSAQHVSFSVLWPNLSEWHALFMVVVVVVLYGWLKRGKNGILKHTSFNCERNDASTNISIGKPAYVNHPVRHLTSTVSFNEG